MTRQRSLFDVVGPVMIGPSSSHTAGAVRLGALARAILGSQPKTARITLHGSFASTGAGHGTDLALVAGLLGMAPDDPRIPDALVIARDEGLTVEYSAGELGEAHPNTAEFALTAAGGATVSVRGSSVGGGDVLVTAIDGFDVTATGELPLLVIEHTDQLGAVAEVTSTLADHGFNIAEMRVSREQRGARALMLIETDAEVDEACAERIAGLAGISSVRRVPSV